MDFRFTPEQETFRQEVRAFIKEVLPPDWKGIDPDSYFHDENWPFIRSLTRKLSQRGWLTMAWPREYGGQARTPMEQAIFQDEAFYWRVPIRDTRIGAQMVGPTLMIYGTQEQKGEFLPRIASSELVFCQGFSEPGTGSDLASLQTQAVEEGDDFVVNGSKIWTSGAHRADYIYLLARTDPAAEKHRGITAFLVDMKSPGVAVRPIVNMLGIHYFNQVFFDNVRVSRRSLVGEKNRGWYVAATSLDFERSGVDRFASNRRTLEELVELAKERKSNGKPLGKDPSVRHGLADLHIANEAGTLVAYEVAWLQTRGQVPNREASMAKLLGSELGQEITAFGLKLLGPYGTLTKGSRWAPLQGRLVLEWANAFSLTIRAGTSEVQRNIIATRGLGLPRA